VIQHSASCAPIFLEDAENGIDRWEATSDAPAGLGWGVSSDKPNHPGNVFSVRIPEPIMSATATLTLREPIPIPTSGTSTLSFSDYFGSDRADTGYVEVSEDGTSWTVLHTSNLGDDFGTGYVTLPLERWTYDVTAFAGRSIFLRLRYRVGDIGYVDVTRLGWFVDDIAVENEDWADRATVGGTTYTAQGLGAGPHCFRIQSTYRVRGALVRGLPSSAVDAVVAAGVVPKPGTGPPGAARPGVLAGTGVGRSSIPVIVALFLGAVALGTIVMRSRRR
jgi:hypothetical protein